MHRKNVDSTMIRPDTAYEEVWLRISAAYPWPHYSRVGLVQSVNLEILVSFLVWWKKLDLTRHGI